MKGLKRKFVAIVLSLVLCCCYTINIYASELRNLSSSQMLERIDAENISEEASTWAVAHCGRYATHDMLSRGWGKIYKSDGTLVVHMGACHQCTRCHLVFVCEGEPLSTAIGHWATWQADSPVSYIVELTTDNVNYTDSKTIEGLSFRYAN